MVGFPFDAGNLMSVRSTKTSVHFGHCSRWVSRRSATGQMALDPFRFVHDERGIADLVDRIQKRHGPKAVGLGWAGTPIFAPEDRHDRWLQVGAGGTPAKRALDKQKETLKELTASPDTTCRLG